MIKEILHGPSATGVSNEGFRFGVLQYGSKVYQEIPLGAAHNLQTYIPKVLSIKFKNDDLNDIEAALEAGTKMLGTR